MSTFYDGTWTSAAQTGPDVYSVDDETKSLIVTRRMAINASNWATTARGTAGPTVGGTATKLLSETEPRHVGNGVVEWEQIFGALPSTRSEYEDFVFGYQNFTITSGPVLVITPPLMTIPKLVTSRVEHTFHDEADPATITLYTALVLGEVDGTIYYLGTVPSHTATEWVGQDSIIRRWRNSNYYERITRYVPAYGLTEA
jgi:hypothetical protein